MSNLGGGKGGVGLGGGGDKTGIRERRGFVREGGQYVVERKVRPWGLGRGALKDDLVHLPIRRVRLVPLALGGNLNLDPSLVEIT